ncbi:MAG: efflux RND transporter periplasmic adaptor subunit [Dehalococcoidales bacterium]
MKNRLIITGLILSLVLVGATGCNPFGGEAEDTGKMATVVRGDLTITVSGSGNLEVADDVKLAFGVGGRIDKLLVEEGDEVSQGDVIAMLETDALELTLNQLTLAYAQAEVAVTEAEITVIQYEAAVTQAEVTLKNAEISLEQTIKTSTLTDIKIAEAAMDTAKRDLDDALIVLSKYDEDTPGYGAYQKTVVQTQARYQTAKDRYDAMLSGFGTKEVLAKQQQVDTSGQSLEVARQSLELAKLAPELARQSLALAMQSLENARNQLDKATITLPFDGAIASVYVDEGDTILATTSIVHLIEPGRMELKVQVDEIDIPEMKLGQKAIIDVDALPDLLLEGKISFISLLPTIEGGVIVYVVTIDFDIPEGVGLRAGMSASTDIIINERSNVLLVPNRAIRRDSRGNPVVEVSIVGGENEERAVTIGISDSFQTEIISGLEADEVVVEK